MQTPANCSWIIRRGWLQVAYWWIISSHTFHVLVAYKTPRAHGATWRRKSTIWVSWCLCPYLFHAFLRFTRQPGRDVALFRCGLSHQEVWGAWPWCCALPQAQWNAPRTVSKLGGTSFHASLWQKRFKMTCILLQFKISLWEFFPFMIFYLVRKSHELIQESNSRLCCIPVTYWHWEFGLLKALQPVHLIGKDWHGMQVACIRILYAFAWICWSDCASTSL